MCVSEIPYVQSYQSHMLLLRQAQTHVLVEAAKRPHHKQDYLLS